MSEQILFVFFTLSTDWLFSRSGST